MCCNACSIFNNMENTLTKTQKLIRALSKGTQSIKQIRSKTGLANVTSTIHRLREYGYNIKTVDTNTGTGYRLAA